ncbi:hypothetical protein [Rhizobium sp. M10]|nr:hypothetical protein [Rhizobium sp. M10]
MNIHLALNSDLALGQPYEDVSASEESKPMKLLRLRYLASLGDREG